MPSTSPQPPAPAPRADDGAAALPTAPAPSETFAERAHRLVTFLAECHPAQGAAVRRREQELAEWIVGWQKEGLSRAQHFVAEELGIIVRALSGPAPARARLLNADNERLRWLIARCMIDGA